METARTRRRRTFAKSYFVTALAAVIAAAGVFFYCLTPVTETFLDIKSPRGRVLASIIVPDGSFDHVFIHSIHLTPVAERFRIESSGDNGVALHLFELRYQSSGVGMPSDAEEGYRLENGVFILTINRVFRKIPVMVSIVDGHGIRVGGVLYPFRLWAEREEQIVLSGRIVRRYQFKR